MENLLHIVLLVVSITLNIISQSRLNKQPYYIKHLTLLSTFGFFNLFILFLLVKRKFIPGYFVLTNEGKYPNKKKLN